jgi:hypothetical protein
MGERPPGLSKNGKRPAFVLDRIDNDGNYVPGNCRWTDQTTSMINRRIDPGHANRSKTKCKYGHEFTVANTYIAANGRRRCRTCNRERIKEYRSTEKGAAALLITQQKYANKRKLRRRKK